MTQSGKFVFVTGVSGSGKTTLGELLKKEDEFVHFNVDVWAFGGDPVLQSHEVPGPAMFEKRDPELKAAFDNMMSNGFSKLTVGETPDWSAWEGFFSKLCPVLLSTKQVIGDRNLVVTFSVYLRSVRDYLRSQLGNDLVFVVLDPQNVGQRKVAHLKNTAAERGQTLSQFLRSFHPDSDAPDLSEEVIVDMLVGQAQASAKGFEPAQEDEPSTLAIGDLSVNEVHMAVRNYIQQLP